MPRQKLASPASTARSSKLSCALIGCGTETASHAESSNAGSSTLAPAVSTLDFACESGIVLGALVKRQSALRLNVSALARTDTVQASATLAAANVSFRLFMRTVYHITPFGVKGKSDGAPLEREVD